MENFQNLHPMQISNVILNADIKDIENGGTNYAGTYPVEKVIPGNNTIVFTVNARNHRGQDVKRTLEINPNKIKDENVIFN